MLFFYISAMFGMQWLSFQMSQLIHHLKIGDLSSGSS